MRPRENSPSREALKAIPPRIALITLGCPKNQVDSGRLARSLAQEGFVSVGDPRKADILLINTCGFIQDAKRESIEEILKLARMKRGGKARKLVVFGCLAQRYRAELAEEIEEIDALFGVGEEDKIVGYCKTVPPRRESLTRRTAEADGPEARTSSTPSPTYAYIKIAEGCNRHCTFCVIPSIRGRFRSEAPDVILREAEQHIRRGVREIILIAQDITSYGIDMKGYSLERLLRELAALDGDFFIRLLYLYPTMIDDRLLSAVTSEAKMLRYLDIPLQHSEDRILRLMGRRGTRKEYLKLIMKIRRAVPGVTLRTSLIAGFPGETEEEFRGLVDFIEEVRFDRLGVFTYSREEGTPSAALAPQIPERIRKRRRDEIMKCQSLISLQKNQELIGGEYGAVVEESDGRVIIGRLWSQAPEIDGELIIETSPSEQDASAVQPGDIVRVVITDAYDYDLKARLVTAGSRGCPSPIGGGCPGM